MHLERSKRAEKSSHDVPNGSILWLPNQLRLSSKLRPFKDRLGPESESLYSAVMGNTMDFPDFSTVLELKSPLRMVVCPSYFVNKLHTSPPSILKI